MTIEPPIPKKEFKSDSQTKKKVPAIRRIVFVRTANPLEFLLQSEGLETPLKDWMSDGKGQVHFASILYLYW